MSWSQVGTDQGYVQTMQSLRRSSATSRHKDRRAEARKGHGKGGRAGAKAALRKQRW